MAVIKVKIFVPEIANVLTLFDAIEVQRSESGPPGFTDAIEITEASPTVAEITGTTEGPYVGIQGADLKLIVDQGSEQSLTFVSPDPISLPNVIGEINGAFTGVVASDDGTGKLKLESVNVGTDAVIEVTGGTAVTALGLTVGQKDNGEDQHVQLLTDVSDYAYDDQSGQPSNYYRTRYINTSTNQVSTYSDWILGSSGAAIDASLLIIGKIKLANIDGTAMVGQVVTITNTYDPVIADGYFVAGKSMTMTTDGVGQAQITLIKGSLIGVVVEGSSVVRRIRVPTTGTEFDLLDASLITEDMFGIQVPDLPAAVRRS